MAIDLKKLSTEQVDAITAIAAALQDHADTERQLDAVNREIARLTKLREELRASISVSGEAKNAAIEKAQRLLITVEP